MTPPRTEATLDSFAHCTIDDVRRVITTAPDKSCALDPLPTTILKEFLPELLPFLTDLCNSSLTQGCLPTNQRHSIVFPRLKKAGARPISNLTFMCKITERLVFRQRQLFSIAIDYCRIYSPPIGDNTALKLPFSRSSPTSCKQRTVARSHYRAF